MIWCLHGAVGMAADWSGFASRMGRRGHAVRRVDLWKFLDCASMPLEQFGRSFCDEVQRTGEDNILLGYSMGGRLALHALLEAVGRGANRLFSSAVIVSAHPGLQDEEERLRRMARDAEWAALALTGDWKAFLDQWDSQALFASPSDADRPELGDRRQLLPRRQAVARSFMDWSLGKQADLRERLSGLTCPVLWVTGERDEKFRRLAAEVVPDLPLGRQVTLEGAGHRVPWDAPAVFSRQVAEFIGDRDGQDG